MTIKQQVENILRAVPSARNSDDELQIIYMQKAGMNLSPKQIEVFKQLPSMETIRRIRQKLQEEGKYPASENVNEARYNKFKKVRSTIKDSSPEYVETVLEDGRIVLPDGRIVV